MEATLTPQVVKTYTLQLTMDEREARALLAIVGVVGGSPMGPRSVADRIFDTLYDQFAVKPETYLDSTSPQFIVLRDTWPTHEGEHVSK